MVSQLNKGVLYGSSWKTSPPAAKLVRMLIFVQMPSHHKRSRSVAWKSISVKQSGITPLSLSAGADWPPSLLIKAASDWTVSSSPLTAPRQPTSISMSAACSSRRRAEEVSALCEADGSKIPGQLVRTGRGRQHGWVFSLRVGNVCVFFGVLCVGEFFLPLKIFVRFQLPGMLCLEVTLS